MNATTTLVLPPRSHAPTDLPRTPALPTTDPLRAVPELVEALRLDCRILPHKYIDESLVTGGGE